MSRTRRSSSGAEERPSCVPPPPCVSPPLVWKELSEDERKQLLPAHGRQPTVMHDVRRIVSDVRMRGDAALYAWTAQLDRVRPKRLRVPEEAFAQAEQRLSENEKAALQYAKDSITAFHRRQLPDCVELHTPDSHVERLWRPLSRVGLYVPGGEASLPSTMLMLGIPATLAGCSQCAVCTPPKADGLPDAAILYAARLVGLEEVFALGGAQAIAAMAFGTRSVARVDKIFGPGNVWVHEAKRFVGGLAGGPSIDMLAGPSEVLVIADHAARADWIAADLIAQAEHDVLARAILVSPSRDLLARVGLACRLQLSTLPRRRVASVSLADSPWFVSSDLPEAFEVSNFFAPEHLILHVRRRSHVRGYRGFCMRARFFLVRGLRRLWATTTLGLARAGFLRSESRFADPGFGAYAGWTRRGELLQEYDGACVSSLIARASTRVDVGQD